MRPLTSLASTVLTIGLLGALVPPATAQDLPAIEPQVETPPLFDDEAGGNANGDDPAIWVHPTSPAGA